ncbi:hypothetical protein TNCT6_57690 [Streptomyces sp. 6-11-2]|nr:hypothetical protein TNCT6_57690 [Streptomyces sp. 6-11-2]
MAAGVRDALGTSTVRRPQPEAAAPRARQDTPADAASGEAGDEQGGPCADVGGLHLWPVSRCGPVKRHSVGENSWNSAPRRVRWGQEVAPKAEAYSRSGPVLISQSNAQDLWIGSGKACGGRTFPNDPVMVTE